MNTRANVEEIAKQKGLELVQIDGIPEGFSFKHPDLAIGGVKHEGVYVAFLPNKKDEVIAQNEEDLLYLYKIENGKRNN